MNIYKGKGDALDWSNYRGLKLQDQIMKVMERVLEGMREPLMQFLLANFKKNI